MIESIKEPTIGKADIIVNELKNIHPDYFKSIPNGKLRTNKTQKINYNNTTPSNNATKTTFSSFEKKKLVNSKTLSTNHFEMNTLIKPKDSNSSAASNELQLTTEQFVKEHNKFNIPMFKLKLMDELNNDLSVTNNYESTSKRNESVDIDKANFSLMRMSTFQKTLFLQNPLDEGVWLRGKINVNIINNEKVFLYYLENETSQLVMSAKKTGRKEYLIYRDNFFLHKIGVISKNFIGNNYKVSLDKNNTLNNNYSITSNLHLVEKTEICSIKYSINLFGLTGPLKVQVKLQSPKEIIFNNKYPTYSRKYKCYVLNYINRRIKTSTKNFQLINKNNNVEDVLLQFGETNIINEYIIDYKYPFSPLQAFGIGISCIEK